MWNRNGSKFRSCIRMQDLVENAKTQGRLLYFTRYIDDLFAVFPSQEDANWFWEQYNRLHPNIKLTGKDFEDQVDFLDVSIFKGKRFKTEKHLDLTLYQKHINKYLYFPFSSQIPLHAKKAFVQNELRRAIIRFSHRDAFLSYKQILLNRWLLFQVLYDSMETSQIQDFPTTLAEPIRLEPWQSTEHEEKKNHLNYSNRTDTIGWHRWNQSISPWTMATIQPWEQSRSSTYDSLEVFPVNSKANTKSSQATILFIRHEETDRRFTLSMWTLHLTVAVGKIIPRPLHPFSLFSFFPCLPHAPRRICCFLSCSILP